jgi:hypothetical protein
MTRVLFAIALLSYFVHDARAGGDESLEKFGEQMSYFYLNPTKQNYDQLQSDVDRFAAAMANLRNKSDVSTAVFLARISQKYNWDITGKSNIANMAREIKSQHGELAKYVENDQLVDPGKLDIWWSSFFGTGETKYLSKILRYAEPPQKRGRLTNDLVVAYAAAWSFKANCGQHKAVAAFAKQSLDTNAFPSKKEFLKESIAAPKHAGHYR